MRVIIEIFVGGVCDDNNASRMATPKPYSKAYFSLNFEKPLLVAIADIEFYCLISSA